MSFLEGLQFFLIAVAGLFLSYRMAISVAAIFSKEAEHFTTAKKRKFAIILLAKTDESIARSLYSLSGVVYPKNLYDLIVVADNITEKSAQVAEKLGAIILVANENKSQNATFNIAGVFEQILSQEMQTQYDAVVLFHTNSLVSGNYLEVMNYYLEQGFLVTQGGYRALPTQESRVKEMASIELLIDNYVLPMGNKVLGLLTPFKSNGTCFSTTVLQKYAWQNLSQYSDTELGYMMQRDGIGIEFVPEAVIFVDASLVKVKGKALHFPSLNYMLKKGTNILTLLTSAVTFTQLMSLVFVMLTINLLTWSLGITASVFIWFWAAIAAVGSIHLYTSLTVGGLKHKFTKVILNIPIYTFHQIKRTLGHFWEKRRNRNIDDPQGENQNPINDKEEIVQ